jgi:predicted phosphodiesterase
LGDVVGYNADSDEVARMLEQRGACCIAGNHDLIALGRLGFERCWYQAAHALSTTRRTLSPRTRDYLAALPPWSILEDRVLLVHGDLDDPTRYLRATSDLMRAAARVRSRFPDVRLVLFGHTHDARVHVCENDGIRSEVAAGLVEVPHDGGPLMFVNPGSIDAQRKRGPRRAELAVLDTGRGIIELCSVPYDDAATERKARRGGYRLGAAAKLAQAARKLLRRVGGVVVQRRPAD